MAKMMELLGWAAMFLVAGLVVFCDSICRRRLNLNLPPGPRGIPVLGNLGIFSGCKLPHVELFDLAKKHGPIMYLRLGAAPCIVVSSPELYREIFKNQDHVFASRPPSTAVRLFLYGGKDVAFAPYGQHWRFARKIVTLELLTQKRIHQFESLRMREVSTLITSLLAEDGLVNVHLKLKALTFNFTTQICFSKRFFRFNSAQEMTINAEEAREFTLLIEELFKIIGAQLIGDYIPYLGFLDRFHEYRKSKMVKTHKRLDEFINRIVEERRGMKDDSIPDFLGALLTHPGEEGSGGLDDQIIKALCVDMLVAGTDTSANALEWIMTELLRHPDILAQMQAEVESLVGTERLVTEADLPKLPYLAAVVKESFRVHPPGGFLVPHMSTEQTKVMGYDIPINTRVFANQWALGRSPLVWDRPEEFLPDRFMHKFPIDVKGQDFELLPFGTGRRGCPGIGLGLTMVHYALARLVQAFNWTPPKGVSPQDVSLEADKGMSLPRAQPLEALALPRLQLFLYDQTKSSAF